MSSTNLGPAITTTTNTALALSPPTGVAVANSATNTTSFTLAAASMSGGDFVAVNLTGTLGGAATVTTDTVANVLASLAVSSDSYLLRVINSSAGAFAWTVAGGTGFTTSGTMTIAQNTWRDFVVSVTQTGGTITSVGTGTYS